MSTVAATVPTPLVMNMGQSDTILLRIVDPEFQTGVIEDFGFAWIFLSVGDMILVSLCPMFITSGVGTVAGAALICLSLAFLAACKALTRRQNQAA